MKTTFCPLGMDFPTGVLTVTCVGRTCAAAATALAWATPDDAAVEAVPEDFPDVVEDDDPPQAAIAVAAHVTATAPMSPRATRLTFMLNIFYSPLCFLLGC
jgi:hypothetical protein